MAKRYSVKLFATAIQVVIFALVFCRVGFAEDYRSLVHCENEVNKTASLLLKTALTNDDIIRFSEAIDQIRNDCRSGTLAGAFDSIGEINEQITNATKE